MMSDLLRVVFPPDFSSAPPYNMTLVDERFQLRSGIDQREFIEIAGQAFQQAEAEE